MKLQDLIEALQKAQAEHGNLEVKVVDGFQARVYSGDFVVQEFEGAVDIGIGGCIVE